MVSRFSANSCTHVLNHKDEALDCYQYEYGSAFRFRVDVSSRHDSKMFARVATTTRPPP